MIKPETLARVAEAHAEFFSSYGKPAYSVVIAPQLEVTASTVIPHLNQITLGTRSGESFRRTHAVLAHEMAHLALMPKLLLFYEGRAFMPWEFSVLADDLILRTKSSQAYRAAFINSAPGRPFRTLTASEVTARQTLSALTVSNPEVLGLRARAEAGAAYHEFFADVASVLYYRDPEILASAGPDKLRRRSFLGSRRVREWRKNPWAATHDAVTYFEPARAALWRAVLSDLKPGQETAVLESLTEAANRHYERRFTDDPYGGFRDVPARNRELFSLIVESLRSRGVTVKFVAPRS